MPPRQPHLLTGRVERDRQPGQHPVSGADRVALQEHLRFGVDESRRAAVGDGHALGGSGGPGGEDDPCVVSAQGRRGAPASRRTGAADQALLGDHRDDVGLGEHQFGALLRVVGVNRNVGGAGRQCRQDGHIQRIVARRHPDSDAVAAADATDCQPGDTFFDIGDQLGVGELDGAVVERRCVGIAARGLIQDVDQGARLACACRTHELRGDLRGRIRCCHGSKLLRPRGYFTLVGALFRVS